MLLDKIAEMEEEYINLGLKNYDLNEFLEEMSIFLENEDNSNNDNKVQLMTIHQAKGLEFKYVFIVGLEEGNYPCYCCDCEENDEIIDEERRILYVAITSQQIDFTVDRVLQRQDLLHAAHEWRFPVAGGLHLLHRARRRDAARHLAQQTYFFNIAADSLVKPVGLPEIFFVRQRYLPPVSACAIGRFRPRWSGPQTTRSGRTAHIHPASASHPCHATTSSASSPPRASP